MAALSAQAQPVNHPYPQTDKPRELGFIQRMEGLTHGLGELQERLETFTGRLAGGLKGDTCAAPAPAGLDAILQCQETRLRECMALVAKLNEAF